MKVTNIKWQAPVSEAGCLPSELHMPITVDCSDVDEVCNYLSDSFGWLVESFIVEID